MTLDAVLFDWGDTLIRYDGVATEDFAVARSTAGLAALRRDGLPDAAAIGNWFRGRGDELFAVESEDEIDYIAMLAACFSELGCELADDDVRVYAREALWEAAMTVGPEVHELLDELRARSLRLAVVSNTALPAWLLEPVFQRQGLAERVDAIVLSSEVGKRKPHPAIFQDALAQLGVAPERALFVGDRRYQDVLGASRLGMRTVLARWFRDDVNPDGGEPDFEAAAPLDVLEVVVRIGRRS